MTRIIPTRIKSKTKFKPFKKKTNFNKTTNIEQFVKDFLNELKIKFVFNRKSGYYKPDFRIESPCKLIIETYGDYWHKNPILHEASDYNKRTDMYADEIWERDLLKLKYYQRRGYKTLVIWENDINKTPAKIKKIIKENLL